MIHHEPWYREAGMEKELQRAWAVYDHTDGNGPEAEQALLEVIRITGRTGAPGERVLQAMSELVLARLSDALHGVVPEAGVTAVRSTYEQRKGQYPVRVWVPVESDFPSVTPGPSSSHRTPFIVTGSPEHGRYEGMDHLYYLVDYGLEPVRQDDPFPDDTVTLDEVEQGIVKYMRENYGK